ncbi:cadherin domain-containing protein [Neobacillus drentensis]|uniref:cadherin domain-containing protein n=1 Tax=Neobacillus drentensis TaxID=220684 RepID=UPI0030028CD1
MKQLNFKVLVAWVLVIQLALLGPVNTIQHSSAASQTMSEQIIHEFSQNTWAYNHLFTSPSGQLYLSHVKNNTEIVVKKWSQGTWDELTSIKTSATGDTNFNGVSDLAVDANERVHVAFLFEKGTGLTSQRGVKYGVYQNGSWSFQTVDSASDTWGWKNMFEPSIAIDSNGKAHVVYMYNDANDPRKYEIRYATNQSGSWVVQTLASGANSKDEVKDPQIEVDRQNKIHITYVKEDNQNSYYGNYYYTHKLTSGTTFSAPEKIVDAVSDQKGYYYTPFVVDAAGKISFAYYQGNSYSSNLANETFITHIQTNQSGTWTDEVVYSDQTKITYPVQVTKAGSKNVLLMYSASKNSAAPSPSFFAMEKDGGAWTKGTAEVTPSITTQTPREITYSIDQNGNIKVVLLDNGLRKISFLSGTGADFGLSFKSSNAGLNQLTVSPGGLQPGFSPSITNYTTTVGHAVQTITVTPTSADSKSTVTVNGLPVASGSSASIPLNVGSNSITVVVTAENGTTKVYSVTVTREAPSNNANLSHLTVSTGNLSPSFDAATQQYQVSVPASTNQIRVTPMVADDTATVTVDGQAIPSGQDSNPINLEPGENPIPVVVTAQDGTTKPYTVIVKRNQPPTAADKTLTVDENAENGTIAGILPASDAEGQPLTYSILAGNTNNIFVLNSATGEIKVAEGSLLDYETTQSYTLTVQVSDGIDQTTAHVKINVKDRNDNSPVPKGFTATIAENAANGTTVGTVTATDVDTENLFTYKINAGNTSGAFAIDANTGKITVADASKLDYETIRNFSLTVQVSDGANTADTTVTIDLTNLNDNTPVAHDASFTVNENAATGTVVGTVTGSDADGDPLQYTIVLGNEKGAFTINPTSGEIVVLDESQLDYEANPSYTLTVQASDTVLPKNRLLTPYKVYTSLFAASTTKTDLAAITIHLNDLNDNRPVPKAFTKNIDENSANGISVGTVTATDADAGSTFTYTIKDGNSAGAFTIDPSSGEITVADATKLDYETVKNFNLHVEVSDGTNTAETTVTVNLTNLNDNSPVAEDGAFTIEENKAANTVIGSVKSSDADGDLLIYKIMSGNQVGVFAIDASNGELTVSDHTQLDYETNKSFTLTVQVSDGASSAEAGVTINLTNLNDTIPVVKDGKFSIDENAGNGSAVGTIEASDADGDSLSYQITSGNGTNAFTIDAATGKITVADSSYLDFEEYQNYKLTVKVSDGIHTADSAVTIDLTNLNDNPPVADDASFTIDEQAANGTVLGKVTARDDDGDALTYSIASGNDKGIFTINDTTGELTVVDGSLLDAATQAVHTLSIDVSDGQHTAASTVTVHLLSSDAALSSLTSSKGKLDPEFKPGTTQYRLTVGEGIHSLKLTPTTTNANATVKINGKTILSGQESDEIALNFGKNKITIEVTAQNGKKVTYTLTVMRLKLVVTTVPVLNGKTGTVPDEDVELLDDNGTLVVELKKDLSHLKFTTKQLETLINRHVRIKIVKEEVELSIPATNFEKGKDLIISLEKLEKNPKNLPFSNFAISAVYDFTILQGDNIIRQFDQGIELRFSTAKADQAAKVYYWNEEKKKWELVGGTYDNGQIKTSTHHFSTFAVFNPKDLGAAKPPINPEGPDTGKTPTTDTGTPDTDKKPSSKSDLPTTATNMYNWLFAGIFVMILGGALLVIQRVRRSDENIH